jgi:hypothetical protein
MSPNTAPEAPTVELVRIQQEGAERATEQRREVDPQEARLAQRRLEHRPEEVEDVHVEADVKQLPCRKP